MLLPALVAMMMSTTLTASEQWIRQVPVVISSTARETNTTIGVMTYPSDRIKVESLRDLQYGQVQEYRAINLFEWIMSRSLPASINAAQLVFANGMRIPMPLNSSQGPVIWLAWQMKQPATGAWTHSFPPIAKHSVAWRDPRPLTFQGNKVVVSQAGFFPKAFWNTKGDFSPFKYANSLVRIELTNYSDWFADFKFPGDQQVAAGLKVFENRCQFCHSVWGSGASYGWDFADPLPIYQKRPPESLYYHVKYPKSDALQRGLMMPHQASMSKREAVDLWHWLKAAATHEPQ
jgi:hypothetical protein